MSTNPYEPPKEAARPRRPAARRGCLGYVLLTIGLLLVARLAWLAVLTAAEPKEWQNSVVGEETWNRVVVWISLGAFVAAIGGGLIVWGRIVSRGGSVGHERK
jgi:hypothetical protein